MEPKQQTNASAPPRTIEEVATRTTDDYLYFDPRSVNKNRTQQRSKVPFSEAIVFVVGEATMWNMAICKTMLRAALDARIGDKEEKDNIWQH